MLSTSTVYNYFGADLWLLVPHRQCLASDGWPLVVLLAILYTYGPDIHVQQCRYLEHCFLKMRLLTKNFAVVIAAF